MIALSIREPWVSKIVTREKTIETRWRRISHRGDLLLVGSKVPPGTFAGKAACVVDLYGCRRMRKEDEDAARCPYMPGLWAWLFRDLRFVEPFHVRGYPGLYEVPDELITFRRTAWTPLTLNL